MRGDMTAYWRARGLALAMSGAGALLLTACIPGGGYRASPSVVAPEIAPPARGSAANASTPAPDDDPLADIVLRRPTATAAAAAPITPNARDVIGRDYVVQPGDTLRGIGNRTGAGSEAIAAANALTPPYVIRAGQRLTIPGGRFHEVAAGQTGIAIARAYGVAWSQIVADNALTEPYILRVGQRLRLPTSARMPTEAERAAALDIGIDDIVTGAQPATTTPAPVDARAGLPGSAPLPGSTATRVPALSAAGYAWPLEGRVVRRFGATTSGRVNQGIDIAAPRGAPVRAARGGTVAYAGNDIGLLGGLVLIDHGGGQITAYGYLDQLAVRGGTRVTAGQVIATVGETGQASAPQLHFELRRNRVPVDPLGALPPR